MTGTALPSSFKSSDVTPGQALGAQVKDVSLVADNEVIYPGKAKMIRITSNDTTAANRTFTLGSPAYAGSILTLHFVGAATFTAQLIDTGNATLSADWEPITGGTLVLQWDAISGVYRELARAVN